MYRTPIARWNGRGFHLPERAAWEIILGHKEAKFCLTIPAPWLQIVKKQIAVVWPKATVKQVPDLVSITPTKTGRLELANHFLFSIRADKRTLGVIPSLLETTKMLSEKEKIAVQVLLDPAPPDWWQSAAVAYESYRAGMMPNRIRLDAKAIAKGLLKATTWVTWEAMGIVQEIISGEPAEPINLNECDKATALRERPVGLSVAEKLKGDALDVTVRIAIDAPNAEPLMRAVWYAFRSLDQDNSFELVNTNPKKEMVLIRRREPGFKINRDYLSIKETSMLTMLPTGPLQEEYGLESIDHRETNIPDALTSGGILLGTITFHGKKQNVYLPTGNHDELCLPHVVIGGMGTGKTMGFGANLAVEAVRNNMGAVVIDPAKGELGDEIEAGLPPSKVTRIRFGSVPVALDWREALHSERSRNRLANELIAFCDAASDEAGAQTIRYMRAAAKAVPNGRLSEVVELLTNPHYRGKLLPRMRQQEREVWETFDQLTDARQSQIGMPVLNRLDVVLGDDYLAECMDADQGLDFVELLQEPRAIVLDIPKAELGAEAVDILASLVMTKLDLAMVLRESKHPVFVVQDEPHQYCRSARIWKSSAVESRKWRFSYCWMFHAWEQIPRNVAAIIQAAGPHYHLYTASKATYRALAEEIAPFEVEEAMKTPRHWAINVIHSGGVTANPFLAKMAAPPSKRKCRPMSPICVRGE